MRQQGLARQLAPVFDYLRRDCAHKATIHQAAELANMSDSRFMAERARSEHRHWRQPHRLYLATANGSGFDLGISTWGKQTVDRLLRLLDCVGHRGHDVCFEAGRWLRLHRRHLKCLSGGIGCSFYALLAF
jgi:hypothetical protein